MYKLFPFLVSYLSLLGLISLKDTAVTFNGETHQLNSEFLGLSGLNALEWDDYTMDLYNSGI